MPDPSAVNSMFARIASRYDFANRLLSGGVDIWWRRQLIRAVASHQPADILDLATGSGDVAFDLAGRVPPEVNIIGMDFCRPMLDEAELKQKARRSCDNISFVEGDGLNLPLEDNCVDAATISFGLRNMADRHRCLTELARVIRPQGRVWVLEFSQPYGWFRPIYYAYLRHLLPTIASLVTGDKNAYDYLCGSISEFPDHHGITAELNAAGFSHVTVRRMTGGIVALHCGVKR